MNKEEKERRDALESQERVMEVYQHCILSVLGPDTVAALWFSVGSLLQRAAKSGWVRVEKDADVAAAALLCASGLLTRRMPQSAFFNVTPKGHDTARRMFHLV